MSVLYIVQEACRRTGIPVPSTVIGNTDENVTMMLAFLNQAGRELSGETMWPCLTREYSFTLVDGQENYLQPADFQNFIFDTTWDQTQGQPADGPLTPQRWQHIRSGLVTSTSGIAYRMKGNIVGPSGAGLKTIFVDPIPTSSDAGRVVVFEYISATWLRPLTSWSAGLDVTNIPYVGYANGNQSNFYVHSAGTTCGTVPPTHQAGAASDGLITWSATAYSSALNDSDVPLLNYDLLIEGARWRFKREKGLPWREIQTNYKDMVRQELSNQRGARTINLVDGGPYIPEWQIIDY